MSTNPSGVNNYKETAAGYDTYRRPAGAGHLTRALRRVAQRLRLRPEAMTVLAGGCGTGNYEEELLRRMHNSGQRVGRLILMDAFQEMLDQAMPKLEPFEAGVEAHRTKLITDALPCPTGTVHYATLVEMIHHLDRGSKLHPHLEQVLAKIFDSLLPGGALSIISTTPTQSVKSRYYQWIGHWGGLDATEDPGRLYGDRYPRLELLFGLLGKVGFDLRSGVRYEPIAGPYIVPKVYRSPRRLLRAGASAVSFFKFAQQCELYDRYEEVFNELLESGRMNQVFKESERWRKTQGTAYCLTVFKPRAQSTEVGSLLQ